jgi:hypothetical protein
MTSLKNRLARLAASATNQAANTSCHCGFRDEGV